MSLIGDYRRVIALAQVSASGAKRQTANTCPSKRSTAACFESPVAAPTPAAAPRGVESATGSVAASLPATVGASGVADAAEGAGVEL